MSVLSFLVNCEPLFWCLTILGNSTKLNQLLTLSALHDFMIWTCVLQIKARILSAGKQYRGQHK